MTPAAQVSWKCLNNPELLLSGFPKRKEKTLLVYLIVCFFCLWVDVLTFAIEATNYMQIK